MATLMKKENKVHLDVVFDAGSKFKGQSTENGLPVSAPLQNLEDLLAWKPDDPRDMGQSYSISSVPYYGKVIPKESTKTLVCHDMAGGYLDDKFVQGCLSRDGNWYYLAYWDIVDTFVYFSHHFVTVPPVGWINSAHTSGVAVLGTFITESDGGFKRCDIIFSNEWVWRRVADQLVEIAKYYRFEGWLLNIENDVDTPNVENLKSFVKYLSDKMHDAIEGSQVIWYDSVTADGALDWQNQLNSENKAYFDACDGIFLNYNWTKDGLEDSVEVAEITDRVPDVYVGVDVFGRGCPGGGGMNSATALEVIRKYGLSAAIFAPGWAKEELGSSDFEKNQHKFWTQLYKHCNTHSLVVSDQKQYLATSFDPGMCIKQDNDKSARFLNLNEQTLMPCLSSGGFLPLEIVECNQSAVTGEGNLFLTLLKTNFLMKKEVLVVSVIVDCSAEINIQLCLGDITTQPSSKVAGVDHNQCFFFSLPLGSIVNEIICTCNEQFSISKLVLSAVEDSSHDSLHADQATDPPLEISIALEDPVWEKESKKDFLSLSCTLKFSNHDPALPLKLFCKFSSDSAEIELGVSRCNKFRINRLSVPNPVFNGPDTILIVKAEQQSPVFPLRRSDLPSRVGELIVTYDENLPYDPRN